MSSDRKWMVQCLTWKPMLLISLGFVNKWTLAGLIHNVTTESSLWEVENLMGNLSGIRSWISAWPDESGPCCQEMAVLYSLWLTKAPKFTFLRFWVLLGWALTPPTKKAKVHSPLKELWAQSSSGAGTLFQRLAGLQSNIHKLLVNGLMDLVFSSVQELSFVQCQP